MSLSAQDWFCDFYSEFLDVCETDRKFGKRVADAQWTRSMQDFLKKLGQKLGYVVKRESLTIDQTWKNEIRDTDIFEDEIPNLMSVKAHLRVLITYVRDYQFPYKAVEIADKVKSVLSQRDDGIGEGEEFLLVIGTKTPKEGKAPRDFMPRRSDWLAYRFHLIFEPEIKADVLQTVKRGSRSDAARKA